MSESQTTMRDLLLENANFWASKGQNDAALREFSRVLRVAPNNPDALAGMARALMETDDNDRADFVIERLRLVAPADPRLASLAWRRNESEDTKALLIEARRLAGENHMPAALATYKKAFGGDLVPDDLAGEYYPVLIASLPADSVDANDALTALGAVADRSPNDSGLQLIYARSMTSLEGTRADGVEKLRALSKNSSVASQARAAWRDAILWQGADFTAQDELETYLRENPSDPQLEAKRQEFKDGLPSEGVRARMRAYEAMRLKQMDTAEKEFRAALAYDANDVDAMIMIAAIYVQAHRKADAQALVDKALALAPDRKQELLGMVGEDPIANARAAAEASGAIARQYDGVAQLTRKGAYDQAAEKLRKLMGEAPNAGNYLQLGDLQARAGQLDSATTSIEHALRLQPNNTDAIQALAAVQTRQGRTAEAAATLARAEALDVRTNNRAAVAALRHAHAEPLRQQALAAKDPAAKAGFLRNAFAIDPSDPWLRLDFARALVKIGSTSEAQTIMADIVPAKASAGETEAALQAGFVWAQEADDAKQAASYADRLPPSQRTPQMAAVQSRMKLAGEIRQAVQPGDQAGTRSALLAMANQPDPTGTRGVDLARASLRSGDGTGMEKILAAALAATPTPTSQQRLAYAGLLTEASHTSAARAMLEHVDRVDQQTGGTATVNGIAAQEADALIGKGKLAEAYKILAPRLAEAPTDRWLNLSMNRWQIASGHARDALKASEAALQQNPTDSATRHVAIDAALTAREYDRAADMVTDAVKRFPDDPYFLMQGARLATLRDRKEEAIAFLKRARAVRARQLASAS